MTKPVVYGAPYSVYVRAVRLTLEEKGVDYVLEPVDVFAREGPPKDHLQRQPFGKIPAFEHDGFALYETGAITRYIEETFPGPALQPQDAKARARMNQVISIMDSYFYASLVWGLYVELVEKPNRGLIPDEARVSQSRARGTVCLGSLERVANGNWLSGESFTLADLHAAPMFALLHRVPEAPDLMKPLGRLKAWWSAMSQRPSMART
jgi:glutathione S-transferase